MSELIHWINLLTAVDMRRRSSVTNENTVRLENILAARNHVKRLLFEIMLISRGWTYRPVVVFRSSYIPHSWRASIVSSRGYCSIRMLARKDVPWHIADLKRSMIISKTWKERQRAFEWAIEWHHLLFKQPFEFRSSFLPNAFFRGFFPRKELDHADDAERFNQWLCSCVCLRHFLALDGPGHLDSVHRKGNEGQTQTDSD